MSKSLIHALHYTLNTLSRGMSEAQLAQATGIPKSTINGLRSGRVQNPGIKTLYALADYFKVTINQLCGLESLDSTNESSNDVSQTLLGLPVLQANQVKDWVQYVNQPSRANRCILVSKQETTSDFCYVMCVSTPAMSPLVPKDALLIIDPLISPKHNDFVLVHFEGDTFVTFRQLVEEGDNRYLYPTNSQFKLIELSQTHIFCGVVIQYRVNLKVRYLINHTY